MTPIDQTARSQTESIAFEFDLPHAPEKVWRALTDPALLAEWLLPVVAPRLAPGAAFTFQTEPYPTRLSLVQSGFTPDQKKAFWRRALRLEDDGRKPGRPAREDPVTCLFALPCITLWRTARRPNERIGR